ncbi:hypothetical protein VCCP1035_1589B, partial [Vibrio cholerae CP1035(8)]
GKSRHCTRYGSHLKSQTI